VVESKWLEVSLTVDGELAEAVSDVLGRYTSGGVVVESNVKYNSARDRGTPYGPVKVFGYLVVDEQLEENRQKLEEALWHLHTIRELPTPQYKEIADENWMNAWKDHYQPIPIGENLLILPAWMKQKDMSRVAVMIDPSMAFGTGTHPSTQLCLELIESYTEKDKPLIDIGCGSGILSIAAVKLGASHALGIDVDNAAVKSTYENSVVNGVADRVETHQGSVIEVSAGQYSIKSAPLVLANILAPILIRLFNDGMANLVETGGTILLSGILAEQAREVRAAGESHGLEFIEQRQIDDWVALAMRKP
jgi:ribosomal protein L11 methyltransferase